jgi:hypothetical protein
MEMAQIQELAVLNIQILSSQTWLVSYLANPNISLLCHVVTFIYYKKLHE